jgi:hypothetical protein
MKQCGKCGEQKPLSDFGKNRAKKCGINTKCKKCVTQQSIESYRRNPNTKRRYTLMRQYGITLEDFEAMKESQKGCCAICNKPFKNSVDTCIDHCHNTGKVRGLLCNHCNRAIGLFKESQESMQNAITYLNK